MNQKNQFVKYFNLSFEFIAQHFSGKCNIISNLEPTIVIFHLWKSGCGFKLLLNKAQRTEDK